MSLGKSDSATSPLATSSGTRRRRTLNKVSVRRSIVRTARSASAIDDGSRPRVTRARSSAASSFSAARSSRSATVSGAASSVSSIAAITARSASILSFRSGGRSRATRSFRCGQPSDCTRSSIVLRLTPKSFAIDVCVSSVSKYRCRIFSIASGVNPRRGLFPNPMCCCSLILNCARAPYRPVHFYFLGCG